MKITILIVTLILIIAAAGTFSYLEISPNTSHPLGPKVQLSVLPATSTNSSNKFLFASVQIYMNNPPKVTTGIQTYTNVTPVFNGTVNSTGNLTTNLSYNFYLLAQQWTSFFIETGNLGANTSLIVEISYFYNISSSVVIFHKTFIISIDPAFFVSPIGAFQYVKNIYHYKYLNAITINIHPLLDSMREYTLSPSLQNYVSKMDSVKPMGIGGTPGPPIWVLIKETTMSNLPIPLAWANNSVVSNNNEEIDLGVWLGSFSTETVFHVGEIEKVNGAYSYSTLTNSSYTSPEFDGHWVSGSVSYNALPLKDNQPHAIMLYANGSVTVDQFREYFYTVGGWQPSFNYDYLTEISSLNVHNGLFEMGWMGLSYGSTWSLMEPHNLLKYLISSSYIHTQNFTLSNGQVEEWSTLADSITSASQNLWPEINSYFGFALSVIGVIAAATGWCPGSGWGELAADTLAIAGLASSIYGLLGTQITNVNDNMYLFGGNIETENPVGSPNNLEVNIVVNNCPTSLLGGSGQFNIPVYDFLAISN